VEAGVARGWESGGGGGVRLGRPSERASAASEAPGGSTRLQRCGVSAAWLGCVEFVGGWLSRMNVVALRRDATSVCGSVIAGPCAESRARASVVRHVNGSRRVWGAHVGRCVVLLESRTWISRKLGDSRASCMRRRESSALETIDIVVGHGSSRRVSGEGSLASERCSDTLANDAPKRMLTVGGVIRVC
jgi:hypothetical protein